MKLHTTRNGRKPHPLAIARKQRGLSLRALAEETGMTHVAISHIETRRTQPHEKTKRLLAGALDYAVEDIWPTEGKPLHRDLRPGSNGHRRKKSNRP